MSMRSPRLGQADTFKDLDNIDDKIRRLQRNTSSTSGVSAGAGISVAGGVVSASYDNATINVDGLSRLRIKPGGVTPTELATSAVGTAAINNQAVTAAKVGSGAATNGQSLVADGAGGAAWGAAASGKSFAFFMG